MLFSASAHSSLIRARISSLICNIAAHVTAPALAALHRNALGWCKGALAPTITPLLVIHSPRIPAAPWMGRRRDKLMPRFAAQWHQSADWPPPGVLSNKLFFGLFFVVSMAWHPLSFFICLMRSCDGRPAIKLRNFQKYPNCNFRWGWR